jgi:hypothetical protein
MSSVVTVVASGTQTTTGNSAAIPTPAGENVIIQLIVSAASGTTPSATFSVQWSQDGINFAAADPAVPFTAITAAGGAAKVMPVLGTMMRLNWTITGTTPSFTFKALAFVTGARSDS